MRLRIFSKPECHLCDEAKEILLRVAKEYQVAVEEVNIEEHPEYRSLYRYEIPVIFLDDRKLFKYRVDEHKLREALNRRGAES